jgi:hypothetical protein
LCRRSLPLLPANRISVAQECPTFAVTVFFDEMAKDRSIAIRERRQRDFARP